MPIIDKRLTKMSRSAANRHEDIKLLLPEDDHAWSLGMRLRVVSHPVTRLQCLLMKDFLDKEGYNKRQIPFMIELLGERLTLRYG